MSRGPEVLAPAGSMDALRAAVECGADAFYLGAGHFNARRNAKNFSEEELAQAIKYCHERGVKVHLTLNTLVSDEELPLAMDLIKDACELGVDALIVQDPGVAALVRAAAPGMELHASTQMAVMTPEGFRALAGLGFTRAVLPRELSYEEVLAIREATRDTGLELEMFIHGALCMCVSGQCYLSASMGGRSGNRGLCAQPCRLRFAADGGRRSDHALSLRDLSAVEAIPDLYEAGVLSFKIEGRMKRPEYVAAAVTACRNAVDGIRDEKLLGNLDAVFSRSGHTDGYLKGHLGHDMFGTRRKDDVVAATPILKDLEQLYAKETRSTPVSFDFTARLGEPLRLTATWEDPADGTVQTVTVDTAGEYDVQAAQNVATGAEKVLAQLQKTGGTGFSASEHDITIHLDENINIPVSIINKLRRHALEELTAAIAEAGQKSFDRGAAEAVLDRASVSEEAEQEALLPEVRRFVRLRTDRQLPNMPFLQEHWEIAWILPLNTPLSTLKDLISEKINFGVEIPRGLYENTDKVRTQLKTVPKYGAAFALAATLDSVELAKNAGLPVVGSFTTNVFNHVARSEYAALGVHRLTLSQEMTFRQMDVLRRSGTSPQGDGLLVYGRSPLMLTRNAPDGIHPKDFADPATLPELTDRKGIRFPVAKNGDAYELLNSRPLYLADSKDLPRDLFHLFWFTTETAEEVADILQAYETGAPVETEFTRGLYLKGVL